MDKILRLLNSRKLAVWLLSIMVSMLIASAFLPNEFTYTQLQWDALRAKSPLLYRIAVDYSTPALVRGPVFVVVSLFLFISTLACTLTRLGRWWRRRVFEFETDRAFSFQAETASSLGPDELENKVALTLAARGWDCKAEGGGLVTAQKGMRLGFWGSVLFHFGLVFCFLAAPLTALTLVRGGLELTEGVTVPFQTSVEGADSARLPQAEVTARRLWGKYYKGIYNVEFGGTLDIGGMSLPFSVNHAAEYGGYRISLSEFGYAPCLVIEKEGSTVHDGCLDIKDPLKGMSVPLASEGMEMFIMFFPDFYKEGGILKSRGVEMKDPVLLVKFMRGGEALHKGLLLKPGEEGSFGQYRVKLVEVRNWAGLVVAREHGVVLIAVAALIGIPGLLIRFTSNGRRIEFQIRKGLSPGEREDGSAIVVKGYSRYYPAFLEEEVKDMAELFR